MVGHVRYTIAIYADVRKSRKQVAIIRTDPLGSTQIWKVGTTAGHDARFHLSPMADAMEDHCGSSYCTLMKFGAKVEHAAAFSR
jgi:hypothetical protein